MSIEIEKGPDGQVRVTHHRDDHECWDDGWDRCGTCGENLGPQQVGRPYAVRRIDGWHIAVWDGECFNVTSSWQSGDRWAVDVVLQHHLLPSPTGRNHE